MTAVLYRGFVSHARKRPVAHTFRHRVTLVAVSLERLEQASATSRILGYNRWGAMIIRDRDYLEPDARSIRDKLTMRMPGLDHTRTILITSPRTLAPRLQTLSIPTCIVAGSDDPESLEPCRELARLLPHAELHVLEGAGHVVNLAKPAEFNDLLRSFLAPFA